MNYEKIYQHLCNRSLTRKWEKFTYEKHHIIPRCMGGTDDSENITVLTYREHYIAHWLLCKIHANHVGINYAFLCMLRKQPTGKRLITSKIYDTIKRNYTQFKRWHSKIYNPGKSINSRLKAKERMSDLKRNPISVDPSKNRTCQPIRVHFTDGTTKDYSYAKKFCNESGVPYATMKFWLKTNKCNSKKHKITRIERL